MRRDERDDEAGDVMMMMSHLPTWALLGSSGWCFSARSDHGPTMFCKGISTVLTMFLRTSIRWDVGGLHPSTVKFLSGA
jgi:hypothetical protein